MALSLVAGASGFDNRDYLLLVRTQVDNAVRNNDVDRRVGDWEVLYLAKTKRNRFVQTFFGS